MAASFNSLRLIPQFYVELVLGTVMLHPYCWWFFDLSTVVEWINKRAGVSRHCRTIRIVLTLYRYFLLFWFIPVETAWPWRIFSYLFFFSKVGIVVEIIGIKFWYIYIHWQVVIKDYTYMYCVSSVGEKSCYSY